MRVLLFEFVDFKMIESMPKNSFFIQHQKFLIYLTSSTINLCSILEQSLLCFNVTSLDSHPKLFYCRLAETCESVVKVSVLGLLPVASAMKNTGLCNYRLIHTDLFYRIHKEICNFLYSNLPVLAGSKCTLYHKKI